MREWYLPIIDPEDCRHMMEVKTELTKEAHCPSTDNSDDIFTDNHTYDDYTFSPSRTTRNNHHEKNDQQILMLQSTQRSEEGGEGDYTLPPLNTYIKTLYILNGSITVIPSLAFMSLINDRVQIPLEYIPSYYAIEFIPYSLKPLYAILAYWMTKTTIMEERDVNHYEHFRIGENSENDDDFHHYERQRPLHRDNRMQRYTLIVSLQILSSLALCMTAFLPPNAIVLCYIIGFSRNFFIAWAEFLNGLAMISSATDLSTEYYYDDDDDDDRSSLSSSPYSCKQAFEEKLLSLYQSQAANCRSIGTLFGQIIVFTMIVGRNHNIFSGEKIKDDNHNHDDEALSDQFVTWNILGTAMIPLIAAIVAYKGKVGSTISRNTSHSMIVSSIESSPPCDTLEMNHDQNTTFERIEQQQQHHHHHHHQQQQESKAKTIQKKRNRHITRVGLYLVLRHSVPSAGGIISSFLYTILRTRPSYLQFKSLIVSMTGVISTWFYSRFISKKYSSIRKIARFIIVITVMSAFLSCLFLPFYYSFRDSLNQLSDASNYDDGQVDDNDNGDDSGKGMTVEVGNTILVLLMLFQIIEGFIGELKFLPSIILGTNTIAHNNDDSHGVLAAEEEDDNDDDDNDDERTRTEENISTTHKRGLDDESNKVDDHTFDKPIQIQSFLRQPCSYIQRCFLDHGILYGTMITCIDFGDTLADWIAGPVVKVFGIQRQNNWHNLDWFILLSSVLSLLSLVFLRLMWYSSKPVDR